MRKLVLFIIIFIVLSVGCTAIMIKIKNDDKNFENISYEKIESEKDKVHEEILEKTLNLDGTYSQNDLIISESDFFIEECKVNTKIPQISGLKNSNVENKINDNIKSKITEKIIEMESLENISEISCISNYSIANYSNILSFPISITSNQGDIATIYCNYNLVDGEMLNFEDLFKKDEELKPILRTAIYKYLVEYQALESSYSMLNPYYDIEDEIWYAEKTWRDENDIEHSEIIEYIPPMSEYEIEKTAEKFLNDSEKCFYFSTNNLYIEIDSFMYIVSFEDVADKVVIYDKYLTEESLYKDDNIESNSFIACTAEYTFGKYKETKYESENFFYDINLICSQEDKYVSSKFLNLKIEEQLQEMDKRIDDYRKKAQNNPDKAYFLFMKSKPYNVINNITKYKPGTYEIEFVSEFKNLFITDLTTKVIVCDIEEMESVKEKILSVYRYYYLMMCGGVINCIHEGELVSGENLNLPVDENIEKRYYNILNGDEINSAKDIFKDDVDYISAIKNNCLSFYANDINENCDIELTEFGICVNVNKENYKTVNVSYDELDEYLKLQEIKPEILPTSTRKIEKAELEYMDKDEMYRAYNEIFARHGHDFQNSEYKYYFNLWNWYEPISGKKVTIDELSEIELYNFNLIKSVIDEKY